jgi:DNA-binding NtrC family response regulator
MTNRVNVLVVDDETVVAATLAAILNLNGFSADFATSPSQAITNAIAKPPDLLLTDVVMPEMSGIDLAIEIKMMYPNCKVLLFSGHASTVDFLNDARKLGENIHIIPKPIHPSDLLKAIRQQGLHH